MRPKVVLVTFLLALGIAGLAFWGSRKSAPVPAGTVVATVPLTAPVSSSLPAKPAAAPAPAANPQAVAAPIMVTADNNAEEQAEAAHHRVGELMTLAMNNDPSSLNIIWSELSNPNEEIRAGALAALVQFGDSSLAPRLRDLAARTDDPQEKVNILAAADQLELPPLSALAAKSAGVAPQ